VKTTSQRLTYVASKMEDAALDLIAQAEAWAASNDTKWKRKRLLEAAREYARTINILSTFRKRK
jgi:hypothetical protein